MSKNRKTRRKFGILTAVLTLTVAFETSAYAQQKPESDRFTSVKQLAALGSTAPRDYTDGPRDAKEVEAFLDSFFAQDAIKQKLMCQARAKLLGILV
ncbi:hypothetical protein [Paenibacillus wynnii]|nr:hypothetical protein [Paenibacillus wynnii]